jgi:predicted transposase YbfD/YdcC
MNATTPCDQCQIREDPEEVDALSLYRALEQVSDHRQKRGVRYPLAVILSLVVLGKLAGMTSLAGIAEWVRLRADGLKAMLPLSRASLPCASTYGNVLRTIEAEEVTRLLADWLTRLSATQRCGSEPSRLLTQPDKRGRHVHVILDGKTLRGTLNHVAPDQQSCHLVALYEAQTGVVLAQQAVPDKSNEITLEATLFTPTHIRGRILSADAMHTQRACCAQITRLGGDYVLFAKANQPTLEEDLRLFFSEPPPDCRDWRRSHTCTKRHGRLERRELIASTELNEFLAGTWPGVEQVFCLTRTVERQGQMHCQTVYGISSLSPKRIPASGLLEVVRAHWRIENRLHWRRDVTLGEDHCQVRKGAAPQVLAVLNNLVLAVCDFLGVHNVAQQMRRFDAHPQRAVRLLLGSLLTFTESAHVLPARGLSGGKEKARPTVHQCAVPRQPLATRSVPQEDGDVPGIAVASRPPSPEQLSAAR